MCPLSHNAVTLLSIVFQLTTDIALATDPEYRKYVEEFANDPSAFNDAFAKVWYKLVNR